MLLFFYFLCQELTSIGALLAGESFGRTLGHFTNRTGQGLLADKIGFMVPCLPKIIVHTLLPRLLRSRYRGPKEFLPFLCNLNCSDLSVKCYKVVLEFY